MVSSIGNAIVIPVPDIDAVLVDWDRLRVYRGAGPEGPFSTLVTTFTLTAGVRSYSYQDTAGSQSSWYQNEYYNSVSTDVSDRSAPYPAAQGEVVSLRRMVRDTADLLGLLRRPRRQMASPSSACGTVATGSTASIVRLTEYGNTRFAASAFTGCFLHLNDGALEGEEREVASFAVTAGVGYFTMAEDFSDAPAESVSADLYALFPTDDYRQAINRARLDLWIIRQAPLVGVADATEYTLPAFFANRQWLTGITDRTGDTTGQYRYGEMGLSGVITTRDGLLVYRDTIPENRVYLVEGVAHPDPLESMDEEVALTDDLRDLWVLSAATELAWRLMDSPNVASEERADWKQRAVNLENERKVRAAELGMRPGGPAPFLQDFIAIAGEEW